MQVQNQNIRKEQTNAALSQKSEVEHTIQQPLDNMKAVDPANPEIKPESGASADNTSKYLKVVSRIENLLTQDALPEAAIKGFVNAIKKQISMLNDKEKQEVISIPEAKKLEIEDIEDLIEKIEEMLTEKEESPDLLNLLKQPRFVSFMQSEEARNEIGTYTANSMKTVKPSDAEVNTVKVVQPSVINASS